MKEKKEILAVLLVLQEILSGQFDPQSISLIPNGVSGAKLARFNLTEGKPAVIKIFPGVGNTERYGRLLISPHLLCPSEIKVIQSYRSDCYLYYYVHGQTVDNLVKKENPAAPDHFIKALGLYSKMWQKTISDNSLVVGYPRKLDETFEQTLQLTLDHTRVFEVIHFPIVINGVPLPCLKEIFQKIKEVFQNEKMAVLSHGDEGWGNVVVSSNDYFFLDHGNVGFRFIAEPVIKALLWFPATMSTTGYFNWKIENGRLVIDFNIRLSRQIRKMTQNAKTAITKEKILFSEASYFASAAIYFLREIQWLARRRRENMKPFLFGLALQSAVGMFHKQEELPILKTA